MEEIFIPASGMAMEEALLTDWLKQPGERVAAGEPVAVVETDKTSIELSANGDGILGHHLHEAGSTVKTGTIIAYVLTEGESEPSPASPVAAAANGTPEAAEGTRPGVGREVDAEPAPTSRPRQPLSPNQRRVAALAASTTPPAFNEFPTETVPRGASASEPPSASDQSALTFRKAIAAQVAESWRTIPHFAVGRDVNARSVTAALALARRYNTAVTLTDFFLSALGQALVHFGRSSDVGLAVATEWGVLIPVVRDAGAVSMEELARRRKDAVDRARSRRLGSDDTVTPYATLSNLGMMDVEWFTGVIAVGQKALLTIGRVADRPVVEGRGIAVRPQFSATLTADHRELDGADSARLLGYFVDAVETVGKESGA